RPTRRHANQMGNPTGHPMSPPPPPTPRQHAEPTAPGRLFWITASAGAAIVLFGLYGLLTHLATSQRADFTEWFVGINLLHDLLIAPAASLIGYLITRLVHRPFRFPLQAGLFATAVVLLIGWAPLRGYGRARVP